MIRKLTRRLSDLLFGYDFFISYAWKHTTTLGQEQEDGRQYAVAQNDELEKRGYLCFLDSNSYRPGDNWRLVGRLAIKKTSRLLLVVTHGVAELSPDFSFLAIGSSNRVLFFDAMKRTRLYEAPKCDADGEISYLQISPDGGTLAVVFANGDSSSLAYGFSSEGHKNGNGVVSAHGLTASTSIRTVQLWRRL